MLLLRVASLSIIPFKQHAGQKPSLKLVYVNLKQRIIQSEWLAVGLFSLFGLQFQIQIFSIRVLFVKSMLGRTGIFYSFIPICSKNVKNFCNFISVIEGFLYSLL
jgi:hypothetical protein